MNIPPPSPRTARAALILVSGLLIGLGATARALEPVAPAWVFPVDRIYPLADAGGAAPGPADWDHAFSAGGFFSAGRLEPADRRTTFRMVRDAERLHVRVDCTVSEAGNRSDAVEFYVTLDGRPDFPCIAVIANRAGGFRVGTIWRAHILQSSPRLYPLDETTVPRAVRPTADGWQFEFSLPFAELGIPRTGFYFNLIRGAAGRHAWSDLGGGQANQFAVYARALEREQAGTPRNGLSLPANLRVGLNRLALQQPDASLRLRVDERVRSPNADGVFEVVVPRRGPVRLELVNAQERVLASYHADVRRPLTIHAPQRHLPAGAGRFDLEVLLDVADSEAVELSVVCRRGDGTPERHPVRLTSGAHSLSLPVPSGRGREVRVSASVALPGLPAAETVELAATHWFMVGVTSDELDRYRDGIASLPTERMYWALLADAVPALLQSQQGTGRYSTSDRNWMWSQMCVYAVALLHKTAHPDNPHHGDPRLLESAILGMEYALRPEIRMEEYGFPDSRSPQAFLLTYDLLKDDIEPERRAYWAGELSHNTEAQVDRLLRRMRGKHTFYSADSETGTNHMAFHVANVHYAGQLFGRAEWTQLGVDLMRLLARHGQPGYFEEQKGSPVNHYTWLSANALGEYYRHSRDAEVLPTLEACARYMTAITTAQGGTMALHDSRTTSHRPYRFGDFVLSRTAEGRTAARARLLGMLGETPSTVTYETLFRLAETAAYYEPGHEADLFDQEREHPFAHGIVVRRHGFHYGLSTISRLPVRGNYRVDAQNVLEILHQEAGAILHGGNSQRQPEAGSFMLRLDVPDSDAPPPATTHDYLPQDGSVAAIEEGHELRLRYLNFQAGVFVRTLSPTEARVDVAVHDSPRPVIFNFFPAAEDGQEVAVDPGGRSLRFGRVQLTANRPFRTETGFRIFNPYNSQYVYTHKPIRCWLELDRDTGLTLQIKVLPE